VESRPLCLFDRRPLTGCESDEHIVPDSLGGWLITRLVCDQCNHHLGSEVDKVANASILRALRLEAGLRVPQGLEVEFFDEDVNDSIRIVIYGGDKHSVIARPYELGGQIRIVANSVQEARKLMSGFTKRERRGRAPVTFGEPQSLEGGPRLASFPPRVTEDETWSRLMQREAAKMAIEYVAHLTTADVALLPSLDSIRAFALGGTEYGGLQDSIEVGALFGGDVWLPRLELRLGAREHLRDVPTIDQLAATMIDSTGRQSGAPANVKSLIHLRHRLLLTKSDERAEFQVILFGWLAARVRLPTELPVPWGASDYRGFLPNSVGEARSR
jgi:hypothetical protein